MNKWERVLDHWQIVLGHTGMTIQQLSHITKIPGRTLLKKLKANKCVRWQICKGICAPIVGLGNTGFTLNKADVLAEVLLARYPTPKYKGVLNWKGVTHPHLEMDKCEFDELERVARGG